MLVCEFQFCVKYIHVHRLVTFEEISEYKMFNVQCFSNIFCLLRFVFSFILFYFIFVFLVALCARLCMPCRLQCVYFDSVNRHNDSLF